MEHRSTLFSKSISYCNSYFIPIIIVRSNVNTCSFYGFYQLLKFLQTVSIYARCANCVNCVFCVNGCGGFHLWTARRAIGTTWNFWPTRRAIGTAFGLWYALSATGTAALRPLYCSLAGDTISVLISIAQHILIFVPFNRPVAYLLQT